MSRIMFGTGEVSFGGNVIGWIREDSFSWGGAAGTKTKVMAAQIKSGPVGVIAGKNPTIAPSFDLIDFDYQGLVNVAGGSVIEDAEGNAVGWAAPSELVNIQDEFSVDTDSGHRITIPNASVDAFLNDGLTLTNTSSVKCTFEPIVLQKGVAPYEITDIPAEP